MEIKENSTIKVIALFAIVGIGVIAGLLALKYSFDTRSRATELACIGNTNITCLIKPQGNTNLDDYTFEVQVIDKSNGINILKGTPSQTEGTTTADGGRNFPISFQAGSGDYLCRVTAKLKKGSYCPGVDPVKESTTQVCKPGTGIVNKPSPTLIVPPGETIIPLPSTVGLCPALPKPVLTIECKNCAETTPQPTCPPGVTEPGCIALPNSENQ